MYFSHGELAICRHKHDGFAPFVGLDSELSIAYNGISIDDRVQFRE